MNIYIDDEIDANTIDEARRKAADIAEEAWHQKVAREAGMAARPPVPPPLYPITADEVVKQWSGRLVNEPLKTSYFGADKDGDR